MVQKKRKEVREIIKQLKKKNGQLKVFLDTGRETFTVMEETLPMLKETGISVKEVRLERIHQATAQTTKGNR